MAEGPVQGTLEQLEDLHTQLRVLGSCPMGVRHLRRCCHNWRRSCQPRWAGQAVRLFGGCLSGVPLSCGKPWVGRATRRTRQDVLQYSREIYTCLRVLRCYPMTVCNTKTSAKGATRRSSRYRMRRRSCERSVRTSGLDSSVLIRVGQQPTAV